MGQDHEGPPVEDALDHGPLVVHRRARAVDPRIAQDDDLEVAATVLLEELVLARCHLAGVVLRVVLAWRELRHRQGNAALGRGGLRAQVDGLAGDAHQPGRLAGEFLGERPQPAVHAHRDVPLARTDLGADVVTVAGVAEDPLHRTVELRGVGAGVEDRDLETGVEEVVDDGWAGRPGAAND